jgi:hypothetical protein
VGADAAGWIGLDNAIPYQIDFENLGPGSVNDHGEPFESHATAPAQRVEITDSLPALLEWDTFEFAEVGFGDIRIAFPSGHQYFSDGSRSGVVPSFADRQSTEKRPDPRLTLKRGTSAEPDQMSGASPRFAVAARIVQRHAVG